MTIRVKPPGITPPPDQTHMAVPGGDGVEPEDLSSNGGQTQKLFPQINLISRTQNPHLLAAVIRGTSNAEVLESFITNQAKKLEDLKQSREQIYQDLLNPDDSLTAEIKRDLKPKFAASGYEYPDLYLAEILRNKLAVADKKSYESYAIVKMLVSVEGMDGFVSDFMMPYLRRDRGLEDFENNYSFCIELLEQNDINRDVILHNIIDFSSVTKFQDFAESLILFSESNEDLNETLEVLLKSSRSLLEDYQANQSVYSEPDGQVIDVFPHSNVSSSSHHIPLMIALSILYDLESPKPPKNNNRHSFMVPSVKPELLEELYRLAPNQHILHGAIESLVNNSSNTASLLKEDLSNTDGETNTFEVLRRAYAIKYHVWANKKYSTVQESIPVLEEFVKNEKDPYLVALTCYMLTNHCGPEGNNKLADIIIEQIKKDETSLPLAALTMLLMDFKDEPYLRAFRRVLSTEYSEHADLNQAYKNLSDVILQTISRNENEFGSESPRRRPGLALDLFEEVGFRTLLDSLSVTLSDDDKGKNDQVQKNLISLLEKLSEYDLPAVRNIVTRQGFLKRP